MEVIKKDIDQRLLDLEKQDLIVAESNEARKSSFVPDEFFTSSPLPIEPVKDDKKVSYQFARLFNSYMHQVNKEPRFNMCTKCKEWKLTEYICCGV